MVENSVLKAMREWLTKYTIKISTSDLPQTDNIETALSVMQDQLADLHSQQNKICELLEKGVYTIDMFSKRNTSLEKEIRKLQSSEKDLMGRKSSQKQYESEKEEIIPTTQHILDSYDKLTIVEKNDLWKIVMERITVFRTPEGEFSMHIYPKLPMPT